MFTKKLKIDLFKIKNNNLNATTIRIISNGPRKLFWRAHFSVGLAAYSTCRMVSQLTPC